MWETKVFRTKATMMKYIEKHGHKMQWEEIYVNNAYGITYRILHIIRV